MSAARNPSSAPPPTGAAAGSLSAAFGALGSPLADAPYVLLALDTPQPLARGDIDALCGWLQAQPCPVIGLGEGRAAPELAAACDLHIAERESLASVVHHIGRSPLAAMTLVQVLRQSGKLDVHGALLLESLAYATLQAGPEFRRWSLVHPPAPQRVAPGHALRARRGVSRRIQVGYQHQPLDAGQFAQHRRHHIAAVVRLAAPPIAVDGDHHLGLDLAEAVDHRCRPHLGRAQRPHGADAGRGQEGGHRLRDVRQVGDHTVARAHPLLAQPLGERGRFAFQTLPRDFVFGAGFVAEHQRLAEAARRDHGVEVVVVVDVRQLHLPRPRHRDVRHVRRGRVDELARAVAEPQLRDPAARAAPCAVGRGVRRLHCMGLPRRTFVRSGASRDMSAL